jgi:hypothetical protein
MKTVSMEKIKCNNHEIKEMDIFKHMGSKTVTTESVNGLQKE